MRLLLSKVEGKHLLKVLREYIPEDQRETTLTDLLLERINLCLMLQDNESKS